MRALMLVLLMVVSGFGADDSPKGTLLRVSGGEGLGQFGFVVEGRVLGGVEGSPWRYGVQATGMVAFELFTTPAENVGSICFVAGKELVPSGPLSFMLFGGLGLAQTELHGREESSVMFNTTYELIRTTDPVVLLGGDLGVSYHRHFGASIQFGAHVSRVTAAYAALQLDVGSW